MIEIDTNKFRFLKLLNGEDVVGMLTAERFSPTETLYILEHPVKVTVFYNSDSSVQIALSKWIPYSGEKEFGIDAKDVLCIGAVSKDMSEYYSQALVQEFRNRTSEQKPTRDQMAEQLWDDFDAPQEQKNKEEDDADGIDPDEKPRCVHKRFIM